MRFYRWRSRQIAGALSRPRPTARFVFWDSASGKSLRVLRRHQGAVSAVTYSADGRWLASAGHDGTVKLWEEKSAAVRTEWRGPGNAILALAFSPDGRWLDRRRTRSHHPALVGHQRQARAHLSGTSWRCTGARVFTRRAHAGERRHPIEACGCGISLGARELPDYRYTAPRCRRWRFHPDGRWLASGTEDRTVRLVETAGTQSQTFVMALASDAYTGLFTGWNTACGRHRR